VILGLFAALVIVIVGGRVSDRLRLRELESILGRLPEDEARRYYELLRRRERRVMIVRALALASLITVFYVYRQRLVEGRPRPAAQARSNTSTSAPSRAPARMSRAAAALTAAPSPAASAAPLTAAAPRATCTQA
jgi:hypothetical protein